MADPITLYQRLPYPLRVLAASARGYRLRGWRYGPDAETLVIEALERETWSARRWQDWRDDRLAPLLHRAATRVPYYAELWQRRRRRGDKASWEALENWPILAKEAVRARPRAFVADDRSTKAMFELHTSGTSGTPLTLWQSRSSVRAWYALLEARARRWNGVSRWDRWAILGGKLVVRTDRDRPPFWVWNKGLRQLYLSSYHLATRHAPAYVGALRAHNVEYILGYPSALDALARGIIESGADASGLTVAVSNAEPLYAHQRHAIETAFGCPVRDTYGMVENVCGATECAEGALHLWPEAGITEVIGPSDEPVQPRETGRLICTGLLNPDMPLVRYDVGDRGSVDASPEAPHAPCSCGRTLPVLQTIEGRAEDVLVTASGREVGRIGAAFTADLRIREAQVIQEALERIRVRLVPAPGFAESDRAALVDGLRDRVGDDMEVVLETVETIPRSANNKFRAVVSHVSRPAPAVEE